MVPFRVQFITLEPMKELVGVTVTFYSEGNGREN